MLHNEIRTELALPSFNPSREEEGAGIPVWAAVAKVEWRVTPINDISVSLLNVLSSLAGTDTLLA